MVTYEVIGNVIENFVILIEKSITCTGMCETDNRLCALRSNCSSCLVFIFMHKCMKNVHL